MRNYPNFYETIAEARIRLQNTIVLYDGRPYSVYWIGDHWPDNIFRVYLIPLEWEEDEKGEMPNKTEFEVVRYSSPNEAAVGSWLDRWMEANPKNPIIRKQMNSPYFNRFKPFDLGMVNQDAKVFYVERQPVRSTVQGLSESSVDVTRISMAGMEQIMMGRGVPPSMKKQISFDIYSEEFEKTILGIYPTLDECMENLTSPDIINSAAAFHRHFAVIRGPIDMLFLAYKRDIIAAISPNKSVKIGRDFHHLKEAVDELGVFGYVGIQV